MIMKNQCEILVSCHHLCKCYITGRAKFFCPAWFTKVKFAWMTTTNKSRIKDETLFGQPDGYYDFNACYVVGEVNLCFLFRNGFGLILSLDFQFLFQISCLYYLFLLYLVSIYFLYNKHKWFRLLSPPPQFSKKFHRSYQLSLFSYYHHHEILFPCLGKWIV